MSTPTEPITDPAAGNPPPSTEPTEPEQPPAPDAVQPPAGDGDEPLGPAGEKALAEFKKRAREAEAKLKEFEDAEKTEAERAADALAAATERADKATRLAVSAKVEALAAGRFTDPQDAVDALGSGTYLTDEGAIDAAAITTALDELLTRKPHWAASEPGPRVPRPDPAQGARPSGPPPGLAQQIAEAEASGNTRLVLALKTQQLREVKTSK